MKALIVKTSSMGDVIHALPVLTDIKKAAPETEIHWLVESAFADLPRSNPLVEKVICCNVRKWKKSIFSSETRQAVQDLSAELKKERYDLVVDLQGLIKSAVLGRLAKAPFCGYDRNSIKEPLASFFYDRKASISRSLPAIERNRRLAAFAFQFPFEDTVPDFGFSIVPSEEREDYLVCFANTSRETKLWPENYWVELSKQLNNFSRIIFPWGSPKEKERVEGFSREIGERAFVPEKMTIGQLIPIIQKARAVVGLDTGMTHLSAALGTPTVGIFRDYPVELVPLSGNGPKVSLGGVGACPSVEEVKDAVKKVLNVHSATDI